MKTRLITKDCHKQEAIDAFEGTQINITTDGISHLGAALGRKSFSESFVKRKVESWSEEFVLPPLPEPILTYCFFMWPSEQVEISHKDLTNIGPQLKPLEDIIRSKALSGKAAPNDLERDLLALPPRLGGLATANKEFEASKQVTAPLVNNILDHNPEYSYDTFADRLSAKADVRKNKCQIELNMAEREVKSKLTSNGAST